MTNVGREEQNAKKKYNIKQTMKVAKTSDAFISSLLNTAVMKITISRKMI